MKRADFRIVTSTAYAGKVSMRPMAREGEGLREVLTAAGFQDGDQVVLIERSLFERLLAAVKAGEQ